jgi:hypothetical protein
MDFPARQAAAGAAESDGVIFLLLIRRREGFEK